MKSSEAKWIQVTSSEIKWNQMKSSEITEVKWNQVNPSEIIWSHATSSGVKWNRVKSNEIKWNQVKSSELKWNHMKSSEITDVKVRPVRPSATDGNQVRPNKTKWNQVRPSGNKWSLWNQVKAEIYIFAIAILPNMDFKQNLFPALFVIVLNTNAIYYGRIKSVSRPSLIHTGMVQCGTEWYMLYKVVQSGRKWFKIAQSCATWYSPSEIRWTKRDPPSPPTTSYPTLVDLIDIRLSLSLSDCHHASLVSKTNPGGGGVTSMVWGRTIPNQAPMCCG